MEKKKPKKDENLFLEFALKQFDEMNLTGDEKKTVLGIIKIGYSWLKEATQEIYLYDRSLKKVCEETNHLYLYEMHREAIFETLKKVKKDNQHEWTNSAIDLELENPDLLRSRLNPF